MVESKSIAISSQSLLHRKTTISSPEIFFSGSPKLQKHFITDFVLYSPLCIALNYQMHDQSEHTEKNRSINLFLNWHREETLILFSH